MKQPTQSQPAPHEWRNLYHAADELRRLEAERILPADVPLVVEGIEPGEHLFFMNQVTPDDEALLVCCETAADFVAFRFGLDRMADEEVSDEGTSSLILSLSGLRVVSFRFCDRSTLTPDEVERLRQLRIRYPGGGAVWPSFLSFFDEPGSGLTRGEVLRLTHGFEVLASFLPDIDEEPEAFFMEDEDELLLLHTIEGQKGERLWQEGWTYLEDLLVEFPDIEEMVDQLDNPDHPGWSAIDRGTARGRATYLLARDEFTPEQIEMPGVDQTYRTTMMFERLRDESIFGLIDPREQGAREIIRGFLDGLEGVRKIPSAVRLFDDELKDMLTPLAARLGFDLEVVDDPGLRKRVGQAMLEEVRSRLEAGTILPLPPFYYGDGTTVAIEDIEGNIPPASANLYRDLTLELNRVPIDIVDREYLMICQKLVARLVADDTSLLQERKRGDVAAAILHVVASRNELWTDTYTPNRLAELYDSTVETIESLAAEIVPVLELDARVARWLHSSYIEGHPDQVWVRSSRGYVCDVRELPEIVQDLFFVEEVIPSPPHHALAVAIEEALPMRFYVVPEHIEDFNQSFGTDLTPETPLTVKKIGLLPALQEIVVGVRLDESSGQLTPLTLLGMRPDPDHPLAADIELYRERKLRSGEHMEAIGRGERNE